MAESGTQEKRESVNERRETESVLLVEAKTKQTQRHCLPGAVIVEGAGDEADPSGDQDRK